jgi:hypothetical protein
MDPAPVQRDVERDDAIPVAFIYPASVNGALCLPRALMDFRASSSPYRFAGLKGPRKFTGSEDAVLTGSPSTLQDHLRNLWQVLQFLIFSRQAAAAVSVRTR